MAAYLYSDLEHENEKLRQRCHNLANEVMRLQAKLDKAKRKREEMDQLFDLQWDASQRAVKRWQQAHPGNDLVWPDSADLMVWLMEQIEAQAVIDIAKHLRPPKGDLYQV